MATERFFKNTAKQRRPRPPKSALSVLKNILVTLCILVAVFYLGLYLTDRKLRPMVIDVAGNRAQAIAVRSISEAVNEELAANGVEYEELVTLETNKDGDITALKTNVIKINQLKATLSEAILKKLQIDETVISIPLGNIINGELLSGRGPRINLRMVPFGTVTTDIENVFSSGGINQTRHQIMLNVHASVGILMPISSVTSEVTTSICIAETVIVGTVPEYYTNVDTSKENMVGDINDYGWNANIAE
ncbi:sporulation protein YunB [Feifania hominis]|uniref:Sporulation protein YunB n=1 Tax=Feifania hominis TaxID=2763660 RepID=A0A926DDX0_9FIRM|nr:sporulation protein YunB [Feifania hominis]MBC8535529.1 sporulation protein YunB [Feifania hominis]